MTDRARVILLALCLLTALATACEDKKRDEPEPKPAPAASEETAPASEETGQTDESVCPDLGEPTVRVDDVAASGLSVTFAVPEGFEHNPNSQPGTAAYYKKIELADGTTGNVTITVSQSEPWVNADGTQTFLESQQASHESRQDLHTTLQLGDDTLEITAFALAESGVGLRYAFFAPEPGAEAEHTVRNTSVDVLASNKVAVCKPRFEALATAVLETLEPATAPAQPE